MNRAVHLFWGYGVVSTLCGLRLVTLFFTMELESGETPRVSPFSKATVKEILSRHVTPHSSLLTLAWGFGAFWLLAIGIRIPSLRRLMSIFMASHWGVDSFLLSFFFHNSAFHGTFRIASAELFTAWWTLQVEAELLIIHSVKDKLPSVAEVTLNFGVSAKPWIWFV